jgi:hypothetical protein
MTYFSDLNFFSKLKESFPENSNPDEVIFNVISSTNSPDLALYQVLGVCS